VTKILAALLSLTALSFAQKLETGAINGAAFRIDVPSNWNGSLVVYCHGYNPQPVKYNDQKLPPFLQVFIDQGFAVAQSGYAAGGWAIQEAAVDTESVRRYFIGKYGRPKETFITGHSMGGFLTMMLMETNPTSYDAGLPLCGPLAAPTWFMSRAAFDGLVLFNYFFPSVLPEPDKIRRISRIPARSRPRSKKPSTRRPKNPPCCAAKTISRTITISLRTSHSPFT